MCRQDEYIGLLDSDSCYLENVYIKYLHSIFARLMRSAKYLDKKIIGGGALCRGLRIEFW